MEPGAARGNDPEVHGAIARRGGIRLLRPLPRDLHRRRHPFSEWPTARHRDLRRRSQYRHKPVGCRWRGTGGRGMARPIRNVAAARRPVRAAAGSHTRSRALDRTSAACSFSHNRRGSRAERVLHVRSGGRHFRPRRARSANHLFSELARRRWDVQLRNVAPALAAPREVLLFFRGYLAVARHSRAEAGRSVRRRVAAPLLCGHSGISRRPPAARKAQVPGDPTIRRANPV